MRFLSLRRRKRAIHKLAQAVTNQEIARAGRVLDWIGVAGGMEHSERVKWLAIELACKQGLTLDQAERFADEAAGTRAPYSARGVEDTA